MQVREAAAALPVHGLAKELLATALFLRFFVVGVRLALPDGRGSGLLGVATMIGWSCPRTD